MGAVLWPGFPADDPGRRFAPASAGVRPHVGPPHPALPSSRRRQGSGAGQSACVLRPFARLACPPSGDPWVACGRSRDKVGAETMHFRIRDKQAPGVTLESETAPGPCKVSSLRNLEAMVLAGCPGKSPDKPHKVDNKQTKTVTLIADKRQRGRGPPRSSRLLGAHLICVRVLWGALGCVSGRFWACARASPHLSQGA